MITAKQREESFRKDLQELLDKHDADLTITDDDKPYGMHSPIVIIHMGSEYDTNSFECTKEYTEFEL